MKRIAILLSEKSTWAGITAALAGAGLFSLGEAQWSAITGLLAAAFGVYSALTVDAADQHKL